MLEKSFISLYDFILISILFSNILVLYFAFRIFNIISFYDDIIRKIRLCDIKNVFNSLTLKGNRRDKAVKNDIYEITKDKDFTEYIMKIVKKMAKKYLDCDPVDF